jgi:thymidylate synthase
VHPSRIWPEEVGPKRLDPSQWAIAAGTLIDDPDSRRAVLLINNPEDEYVARMNGSKDVPCTLSLQFFVRENKLELHAVMRSNDVVWGMPYDVFSFTLFQELMMLELRQHPRFKDLELGPYHHTAGSLHLYERHFGDAKKIVEEYGKKELMFVWPKPMEPLQPVMVECLLEEEELLRTGDERAVMDSALRINVYPEPLRWMADQLGKHRIKRDMEKRA